MDESAFYPSRVGNYSFSKRNGEPVGRKLYSDLNPKERITCVSYISRDGNIAWSPSFILRHFPRGMKKMDDWAELGSTGRFFEDHRTFRNPKGWMVKCVFKKEMEMLNAQMIDENRKIILLVDNGRFFYKSKLYPARLIMSIKKGTIKETILI